MKAAVGSGGGAERKSINPELWYACAGPLVNLPPVGSLVVYFPQGHSEQVAATMHKDADAQIPNYPNLPWKIVCVLHSVTLHADPETDEVYAQMTLQPANTNDKEAFLASDPSQKQIRPQTEFFCKTLTASDTSTHGGFSVPRRAAEKIFPPLDFSMQPPAQELQVKDLHDNVWTFRHIYRGQPKRHLLTTGWSLFVSGKRLVAGDSVLFIRDEKQQLLLGIRRASRQPTNISSSVLSSDSMQIGILAAAAHAYANQSPFTVFYNPRASPSEFVIPLSKYNKAIYSNQLSLGMRFRMMFETEESGTRRYMGTITGISDLDPLRWKNSKWRNLQVGWDETAAGERRSRVSMWEIEPVQAPFFICPPPFFRTKRPRQPGMPDEESSDMESLFKRVMPWLGEENGFSLKDAQAQSGATPAMSLVQWMSMQNSPLTGSGVQPVVQNYSAPDLSKQLNLQAQINQADAMSISQQITPLNQNHNHNQILIQTSQLQQPQIQQQPQQLRMLQQSPQQQQQQQQQQQNHLLLLQQQVQGKIPTQLTEQQMHLQLLQKLQQQHLFGQLPFHAQEQQKGETTSLDHQALLPHLSNLQSLPGVLNQATKSAQLVAPTSKFQPSPADLAALAAMAPSSGFLTSRGTQSVLTEDLPSCSTSPSTNNCPTLPSTTISGKMQPGLTTMEEVSRSAATMTSSASFSDVKPLISATPKLQQQVSISASARLQNQTAFAPHHQQGLYASPAPAPPPPPHIDYLDATEVHLQQNFSLASSSFGQHQQPIFFRDGELQGSASDPRNNVLFGVNIESPLGIPIPGDQLLGKGFDSGRDFQSHHLPPTTMDASFGGSKDTQAELSSSLVSQSFGVPDVGLNSIESAVNDGSSLLNKCSWPPQPQLPRMRTYTKVYKRGAVGRSIDIARYTGYDDLKQDLARMFSIEGQLEDRQRIGWKLVYVDHENDVLLVGDDPWEEFVNCVRCIRILSPQEVQQMSLDGEIAAGNGAVPNQAGSSSDGGNAWRGGNHCDQSSDPSPGSFGNID